MTEPLSPLELIAFLGPIGWQEMVICAFPLFAAAIALLVLYLTGVFGDRNKKP